MDDFLVIQGPNLNLLGEREPEIYGSTTLKELTERLTKYANEWHVTLKHFQSNHEGAIIDCIHENRHDVNGLIINAGALSHYSYAIRDALEAVPVPAVEVHLSDISKREAFRHHSVTAEVCVRQYYGLGITGYYRAIEFLVGLETARQLRVQAGGRTIDRDGLLKTAVGLLKSRHPKYTWVGIYLVEGEELVLHNFIGKPSPHERIPIGKGICGAAVAEAKSIIVPDVNADPRYLACSIETRSEIVVPIAADGRIIGEIDIDSDRPDAFDEDDQRLLENIAAVIIAARAD